MQAPTFLKNSVTIAGVCAAIASWSIAAPAAHAVDTPGPPDLTAAIQSFANLTPNATVTNTTYGYEFTTTSVLNVSSLGIFDKDQDGLSQAHEVGIWAVANPTPLASIQVPAGNGASLVNGFRYQNLSSHLRLEPGTYRIGAFYPSLSQDAFLESLLPGGLAVTPQAISLGSAFYSTPSPNLTYPNQQQSIYLGYIGPNFQYASAPGPLPLLGAGTAFGFSRRLRRRLRGSRSVD